MLKKLFALCSALVPLSLMNGNVALADTGSYRFTDDSSIKSDITQLGLDYSDYNLISDKNYNRTDVIALSESYIDSGNTKQIVNYVYVYNPYKMRDDVSSITLKYNDSTITQKVISSTNDNFKNIVKYKVDFRMPSYSELKRKYDISAITYKDNSTDKIDFGCTYNQDGSNVQLDYDSYIFITGKELFDYCPIMYDKYYNVNYTNFSSNDGSEFFNYSKKWYEDLWALRDLDYCVPDFIYLNFDTNKEIDKINEIALSFKVYKFYDSDYYWLEFGNELEKYLSNSDSLGLEDERMSLSADYTSDYYVIKNENNTFKSKEALCDGFNFVGSSSCSFHNFEVPSKNRLDNFSSSAFFNNLKDDKLPNSSDKLTARQSFENRQVSVLVDILPFSCSQVEGNVAGTWNYLTKYSIRDLSVMRINYTTNMKVVNARCNSGALISSVNSNELPKQGFWQRFITWFNNNFPYSLLIIGGVVVGLPIIISIVVSLFTSGSSALLSGIGKGISKLVTSIVKGLVKLIVAIISLPFKLLGALLSPKKNNSNKTSKKK